MRCDMSDGKVQRIFHDIYVTLALMMMWCAFQLVHSIMSSDDFFDPITRHIIVPDAKMSSGIVLFLTFLVGVHVSRLRKCLSEGTAISRKAKEKD